MEDTAVLNEVMNQMDIAKKNDQVRKYGLRYMLTREVKELPDLPGLIQAVRDFNNWTVDNDPYGEHDFGSINWFGNKVYWKVDYYDKSPKHGCDPLSDDCRRIITVMLAEEY